MHKEVNNGKSKIKTKLTEHHNTNDGLHDRLDLQTKSIAWKLHFLFTMFSATKMFGKQETCGFASGRWRNEPQHANSPCVRAYRLSYYYDSPCLLIHAIMDIVSWLLDHLAIWSESKLKFFFIILVVQLVNILDFFGFVFMSPGD